jgi:nucleoid-associated protein YejK
LFYMRQFTKCTGKKDGVILKLDFKKAYDKLKWTYVHQVLRMKGFPPTWCERIQCIMNRGSVAIKVNKNIGHCL